MTRKIEHVGELTRFTNHPKTLAAPVLTVMYAKRGIKLMVRTQTQGVPPVDETSKIILAVHRGATHIDVS